jgi:error-prone DNA polymerase
MGNNSSMGRPYPGPGISGPGLPPPRGKVKIKKKKSSSSPLLFVVIGVALIGMFFMVPQEKKEESVQQDFSSFQTCLYAHPSQFIRDEAWCYDVPVSKLKKAQDLDDLIPNQVITIFGMILIQQRPPSANGMMFITLEDETGFFNLAITPETLQRIAAKIAGQSFLCVSGKLQSSSGAHSILVKDAFAPKISKAEVIPMPSQQNHGYPSPAKAAMMNS